MSHKFNENRFCEICCKSEVTCKALRIKCKNEIEITPLSNCVHQYETVGGLNDNYKYYYTDAYAYIKCVKCGKKSRT